MTVAHTLERYAVILESRARKKRHFITNRCVKLSATTPRLAARGGQDK